MIAVGFSDGTLKIFDMDVNELCEGISSNGSKIIDLLWIADLGPLSLDESNIITLWSTECE